ncbi:MAG: PIG-L family deacetylase [Thermomicrobia bacterium]|nr:PIG-L family deacetylase [Thermomicrobia bacterium]
MSGLAPAQPVMVVSPHLDDAVFGCGQLLAARPGSVVVTVFAGAPPTYETVTEWDALSGFRPGDDVMAARRDEDARALAHLDARPIWLGFCDSQYYHSPTVPEIARALEQAINQSNLRAVFIPLGLFHSDHHLAHTAALEVLRHHADHTWFAYEEAMYRKIPNIVAERIATLHKEGIEATPAGISAACGHDMKRRAIACYASQLRALVAPKKPGHEDALGTERYWSLAPHGKSRRGAADAG